MIDTHHKPRVAGPRITLAVLMICCSLAVSGSPQLNTAHKPRPPAPIEGKKTGILFVSDDKSFTIWMPATPQRENINSPSLFGPLVLIRYEATDQKAGYGAAYVDYPADKIAHISTDKLLGMATDGIQKKYGKSIVRSENISYHGFRGKEMVIHVNAPAKIEVYMRLFIVKNRMYNLTVEHLQSTRMEGEIIRYLDSLKQLK